ncbi:TasA family protein [Arthrobacter sp. USHLN218]|uniref:TasA family protein n=1 Tax=Arthrobacter sp. USHLN218 TaxID=3081232 RepID=UPI003019BEAA
MGISMKTTSGKLLASVGLVATAAAVAGLGTYGTFSSSTNASTKVDSGTVLINMADGGAALSVAAAGVLPGDSIERLVTLANDGEQNLGDLKLTTADTVAAPTLLSTNTTNGLRLTIESCASAWEGTKAPYTCSGGATTVIASSPIVGVRDLNTLASRTAHRSDNLKLTVSLPTGADNNYQGLKSVINFKFDGLQRSGTVS